MANTSRPSGFTPVGVIMRENTYTAGGTIYPGDLCEFDTAGKVAAADATSPITGIAMHYATTGQQITLSDHPFQQYVAQVTSADVDAITDMNLNYEFTATTGNTDQLVSRQIIDGSSGASDSNLPIKLLKKLDRADNAFGAFVKVVCSINVSGLNSETGTLGV